MKTLVASLLFVILGAGAFAQRNYDDLRILYADGNYEKLVREAEKYTMKDATKKDAEPYIWLAQGLYKISVSGNDDPAYKNAYKEAIAAMNKFLKYDKEGTFMDDEDNAEFLDLMQRSLMEQIENEISTDNYRKAFSWSIKYKKISKNIIGQMYVEAACKFRSDDKSTAFTLWRDAENLLKEITSIEDWSETDIRMLKVGVLESAECLVSVRQTDKAKALLNKVAPWFEEDEDFKAKYDAIVN